ncbi:hypothetical protein FS749_009808, partial [Ceratobasidium sp. UAMH 11750]
MDSPSGNSRRDPPPMFHTPPQPSTPYSMEDAYAYSSAQFTPAAYAAAPSHPYWSQPQVHQLHPSRARDDRQYLSEDQRRDAEMRYTLGSQYTAPSYDSSPQNLSDFFNPALGAHFHPGPSPSSEHAQTFHPSSYPELRQEGSAIPYVPAGYYNPMQVPPTMLSFGVPAYPNYGGNQYLAVPSQRRPADDDGAS